jgi:hypothetical protein
MRLLARALLVVTGFVTAGCFEHGVCTLIGCVDGLRIEITGADAALPAGMHTIRATTPAGTSSCTFTWPPESVANGWSVSAQCQAGLSVLISQKTVCTASDPTSSRCDPVPGQFQEAIQVSGTPASVELEERTGDTVLVSQTVTPTYRESRPNGPHCEPVCRQAEAKLTLP